jgi:hypothetical protein
MIVKQLHIVLFTGFFMNYFSQANINTALAIFAIAIGGSAHYRVNKLNNATIDGIQLPPALSREIREVKDVRDQLQNRLSKLEASAKANAKAIEEKLRDKASDSMKTTGNTINKGMQTAANKIHS